jgi:hypothetical protein
MIVDPNPVLGKELAEPVALKSIFLSFRLALPPQAGAPDPMSHA